MPIVGNLSEFPLPEVLLLIGQRTGRLRLLDIPEFGILDVEVSNGAVQIMRIGSCVLTDTPEMLDKLGIIVQARCGMFEFQMTPVALMVNQHPIGTQDLAMRLVCYVDEQAAQNKLAPISEQRHRLVISQPEIWMEPELDKFFYSAHPLLAVATPLGEMARALKMEPGTVFENLTKLRLLGVIEVVDPARSEADEKLQQETERMEKTSAYFRVAQMTEQIRKLSTRLPAV
jgi:hypothetical protein